MQKALPLAAPAAASEGPLAGLFHPAVADWFTASFGMPTPVQQHAWQVTARHRNALITAPTGSDNTLDAFLAAINDLVSQGIYQALADETQVQYIPPLKALSNDTPKDPDSRQTHIAQAARDKGVGALRNLDQK